MILAASWPSFARQFDIEVIIFKRNVEPASFQESWPDILSPINLNRAFSYRDSEKMSKKNAQLLEPDSYQLTDAYDKLQNHAGFQPLMHIAWRQDDSNSSLAPIFRIRAGQEFSNRFAADGRTVEDVQADISLISLDAPSPKIAQDGTQAEVQIKPAMLSGPLFELDGRIQVFVEHYLYLDAVLDIKIPGQHEFIVNSPAVEETLAVTETKELPSTDTVLTDTIEIKQENDQVQFGNLENVTPNTEIKEFLKSYRMQEKRQMRSGETHYIDHPLLGLIIQVRRV